MIGAARTRVALTALNVHKHGSPQMFSHVMVGSNDLDRSKRFYDATLHTLGIDHGAFFGDRILWRTAQGNFAVTKPINSEPATFANGGTIAFACNSADQVEAWHAAGVAAGGTSCEEPPGPRPGPNVTVYLAYLRDPDGNKLCACCHETWITG